MSDLTQNKNYLSPAGYKVNIDQSRFANLEYFCVNAKIPSITLDKAPLDFRNNRYGTTGDKIDWGSLDIKFIVDEEMKDYLELLGWLTDNWKQDVITKSDIILTIHTSKNNLARRIRFVDAYPISIGEINFDSQNTEIQHLTVDAQFGYSYFEFL